MSFQKDTILLKKFYRYSNKKQQRIRQRIQKKSEKLNRRNRSAESIRDGVLTFIGLIGLILGLGLILLVGLALVILLNSFGGGSYYSELSDSFRQAAVGKGIAYMWSETSPEEFVTYCLAEANPRQLGEYVTGTTEQMEKVTNPYGKNGDIITWRISDITVTPDKNDPEHIMHYSCNVPGIVNASLEKVLKSNITNDAQYSEPIKMEGTLKVTEKDGRRYIELGNGKNPLYLEALVYNIGADGTVPDKYMSGRITSDDALNEAFSHVTEAVYNCYAEALGYSESDFLALLIDIDNYFNIPEIKISDKDETPEKTSVSVSGFKVIGKRVGMFFTENWQYVTPAAAVILLFALWLYVILPAKVRKYNHLRKVYSGDVLMTSNRDMLGNITALTDKEKPGYGYIRLQALKMGTDHDTEEATVIETSMALVENPENDKELLTALCEEYDYMDKKGASHSYLTRGGWALSAMIACMMKDFTPERIDAQDEAFKKVVDEYNSDITKVNELGEKLREIQSKLSASGETRFSDSSFKELTDITVSEFKEMQERHGHLVNNLQSVLARCVEKEVVPLSLIFDLAINPNRGTVRFVRQSALMGLLPWLEKYKNDSRVAKLYKQARECCLELAGRNKPIFFLEVRIFKGCTPSRYAVELKRILNMIEPDAKFTDTEKLMKLVDKEIPGAMELLAGYPLRLINPKESKEGVFEAEPYEILSWIQYQGELNVGQVVKRYHEAFDMTVPNASGVNIRVFTDKYRIVPVIFHEYNHFKNDLNEASVWLKTYIFSRDFYKRYKKANPKIDPSFVAMQNLMGGKPSPKKTDALNNFIAKLYGKRVEPKKAEEQAAGKITLINFQIALSNQKETWCPEIPMPQLGKKQGLDYNTYRIIHDAIVRFLTVPKTLTETQFRQRMTILKKTGKGKVRKSLRKLNKTSDQSVIKMFAFESPSGEVRKVAAEKLKDHAALKELALYDSDSGVRGAALKKINDQSALLEAVLYDQEYENRRLAVKKLTDQEALASVAMSNTTDIEIRSAVVDKLKDIEALEYIAKYETISIKIRDNAVERLNSLKGESKPKNQENKTED